MRQEDATLGPVDVLSPRAQAVLQLESAMAYTQLVVRGGGLPAAQTALANLTVQEAVCPPIRKADHAACLLGALWLWHDWLEPAHQILQNLPSATGSFWHAILHRRQGDFANSRYWYSQCSGHPVLAVLAAQAGDIVNAMPADKTLLRLVWDGWNSLALVDLVEQLQQHGDDPRYVAAVRLQQLEWRMLFDHCKREVRG